MTKQLTGLEELAQKTNLNEIIYYANNIAELARQLKQDDAYINEDYLSCLVDNAQCIIDLLGTIALRRDYEEAERVIKTFAGEEWWRFLKSKYLDGEEEEVGKPKTFDEALRKVANDVVELVLGKQADYGHDNINIYGEMGIKVRTSDKKERLKNLLSKIDDKLQSRPLNEPLKDSWRDIAGNALLALMLDEGTFDLELENE